MNVDSVVVIETQDEVLVDVTGVGPGQIEDVDLMITEEFSGVSHALTRFEDDGTAWRIYRLS